VTMGINYLTKWQLISRYAKDVKNIKARCWAVFSVLKIILITAISVSLLKMMLAILGILCNHLILQAKSFIVLFVRKKGRNSMDVKNANFTHVLIATKRANHKSRSWNDFQFIDRILLLIVYWSHILRSNDYANNMTLFLFLNSLNGLNALIPQISGSCTLIFGCICFDLYKLSIYIFILHFLLIHLLSFLDDVRIHWDLCMLPLYIYLIQFLIIED
jgi:hypothetical protein